jgi:hypothetical protein
MAAAATTTITFTISLSLIHHESSSRRQELLFPPDIVGTARGIRRGTVVVVSGSSHTRRKLKQYRGQVRGVALRWKFQGLLVRDDVHVVVVVVPLHPPIVVVQAAPERYTTVHNQYAQQQYKDA